MDSAVHRINHYPADNSIGFASVYPLDSDLSGGQRYKSFEHLGPDLQRNSSVEKLNWYILVFCSQLRGPLFKLLVYQ